MIENIEFFKSLANDEILNQYKLLVDCENHLNKEDINNENTKIGSQLILYLALEELLFAIKLNQKNLNKKKLILVYNNLMYNIRKLLKITSKDYELEKAIKIVTLENKTILIYINILKSILINLKYESKMNDLSTIYLYYESLIYLHQIIDNYIEKLFTINDNNSKNINVIFNDETDINKTLNNIEKIKSLILEYKNNQENS